MQHCYKHFACYIVPNCNLVTLFQIVTLLRCRIFKIVTLLHCFIDLDSKIIRTGPGILHCNIVALLHCNIITLLHCNIITLLHCNIITLLQLFANDG